LTKEASCARDGQKGEPRREGGGKTAIKHGAGGTAPRSPYGKKLHLIVMVEKKSFTSAHATRQKAPAYLDVWEKTRTTKSNDQGRARGIRDGKSSRILVDPAQILPEQ